jgi:hypothetical protein
MNEEKKNQESGLSGPGSNHGAGSTGYAGSFELRENREKKEETKSPKPLDERGSTEEAGEREMDKRISEEEVKTTQERDAGK